MTATSNHNQVSIEADPTLPVIRLTRDFDATPAQLMRAHTDPELTPGWGGTGRLTKFAGRRKTLEWNLIGALFSAKKAERYDLINRLCEPDALDGEVAALIEILLTRSRDTTATTKYFVKNAADLDMAKSLVFEGAPQRSRNQQGINDFAGTESRNERRKVAMNFWQD